MRNVIKVLVKLALLIKKVKGLSIIVNYTLSRFLI
jgi:hypothetical protein